MQFSSELDEETKNRLHYGKGLMYMLRQKQTSPYNPHTQVIMLICALNRCMQNIEAEKVLEFLKRTVEKVEREYPQICANIDDNGDYSEEDEKKIILAANSVGEQYA